ncbi:hypothetical protein B0H34DRAFT_679067 [Crassisporium funariophilum]|nr:hypothetical protein B0H34DRAFT_679067 [Crassisporium funariophilum]
MPPLPFHYHQREGALFGSSALLCERGRFSLGWTLKSRVREEIKVAHDSEPESPAPRGSSLHQHLGGQREKKNPCAAPYAGNHRSPKYPTPTEDTSRNFTPGNGNGGVGRGNGVGYGVEQAPNCSEAGRTRSPREWDPGSGSTSKAEAEAGEREKEREGKFGETISSMFRSPTGTVICVRQLARWTPHPCHIRAPSYMPPYASSGSVAVWLPFQYPISQITSRLLSRSPDPSRIVLEQC